MSQRPLQQLEYAGERTPLSRLAVVSLVAGFVAVPGFLAVVPVLMCLCFVYAPVAFVAALVAVVFGIMGLREVRQAGGRLRGRGQATAGLAMGGSVLAVYAVGLTLAIVFGSFSAHGTSSFTVTPTTFPSPLPGLTVPPTRPAAPPARTQPAPETAPGGAAEPLPMI